MYPYPFFILFSWEYHQTALGSPHWIGSMGPATPHVSAIGLSSLLPCPSNVIISGFPCPWISCTSESLSLPRWQHAWPGGGGPITSYCRMENGACAGLGSSGNRKRYQRNMPKGICLFRWDMRSTKAWSLWECERVCVCVLPRM
mgnify:CR=1 FL=1